MVVSSIPVGENSPLSLVARDRGCHPWILPFYSTFWFYDHDFERKGWIWGKRAVSACFIYTQVSSLTEMFVYYFIAVWNFTCWTWSFDVLSFKRLPQVEMQICELVLKCSRLSFNRHLCKMDTSVKRTPRVGPCLFFTPFMWLSPRQTLIAGPKGVRLRESWLYFNLLRDSTQRILCKCQ